MFFSKSKEKKAQLITADETIKEELFFEDRKTVKELIAPNGVNPNLLDYLVINDNGINLYTMCLYVTALPTSATFAVTFAPLFNSAGVTSSVFIEPMLDGKSSKQLDKRIIVLDSELSDAETAGDRNRFRKIRSKMKNAEQYAEDVESGNNRLFEVAFLFVLQAVTVDKLQMFVNDFHSVAREKGVELAACYGVHPEAFLSGYPTNKIYKGSYGIVSSSVIKKHVFDKGALSTIFNHTRSSFFHKNGVILGRNINTKQPITYDPYDQSHDSYSVVITGKPGSGKSATMKMLESRLSDFNYYMRTIDFESRGTQGEYAMLAKEIGGVSFLISPKSEHILNMFDVDIEELFDESTGIDYTTLNLAEKITNLVYLIMIIIKDGKEIEKFSEEKKMKRIITDEITNLYRERGIIDGEPDSLYEETRGFTADGKIASGKKKKKMPILSNLYKKILIQKKENTDVKYEEAYQVIIDTLKDYVRELHYCPKCMRFFTKEEYINHSKCPDCETSIIELVGTRPYYDGQSTVEISIETPYINYDISQLVEAERLIALLICMSIIKENYIKKNSINVKKARKMIVLVDEVTRTFVREEARIFVDDCYRTGRKRNVSMWTAAQALADFKGYKETEAIIKNANTLMMFKQDFQDRNFIKESTPLTDSQIDQVVTLGGDGENEDEKNARKGEMCLIDNGRVVFVKVDYLTSSEARFVETDMNKIQAMYKH